MIKIIVAAITLFTSLTVFAQSDLEKLRDDLVKITYDYADPAAGLSVNVAQTLWANDAKVNALGKVTLSGFINYIFVGNKNKEYILRNSDLQILEIAAGQSSIATPTILGGTTLEKLKGDIDLLGNGTTTPIEFELSDGVSKNSLRTYAFQGDVGLGYNTELMFRYIPKTKIDEVINKGYGFALKHNFSRWFTKLSDNKIDIAVLVAYANFVISNETILEFGADRIDREEAEGYTLSYQLLASKDFNKMTINTGFAVLSNNYLIRAYGTDSPLLKILNDGLAANSKTAASFKIDLGATYHYQKMAIYTNFTYSKFPSITLGFNYNI